MDFSQIVPRDLHPVLRWLGNLKEEWLEVHDDAEHKIDSRPAAIVQPRWEWLHQQPGADRVRKGLDQLKAMRPIDGSTAALCQVMDALARCIATGPKIFYPTAEQFDSMQHVELHIPTADYRQPYPSLVVKIPAESRAALCSETGVSLNDAPTWILIHLRQTTEGKNWLTIVQRFGTFEQSYHFQDRPEFDTLEKAVGCHIPGLFGNDPAAYAFSERAARSVLNLMLMLVHYGHKDDGPLHPEQHAKHRKRRDLEHLSHGDFTTVQMVQDVVVRKVQGRADHEPIPSGREMPPHWRRGHWRNQHHGPGNLLTKMIFVNPVLVRGDRAVGELAETVATYRIR